MEYKKCGLCEDGCVKYCCISGEALSVDVVKELRIMRGLVMFGPKPSEERGMMTLTVEAWDEMCNDIERLIDALEGEK